MEAGIHNYDFVISNGEGYNKVVLKLQALSDSDLLVQRTSKLV